MKPTQIRRRYRRKEAVSNKNSEPNHNFIALDPDSASNENAVKPESFENDYQEAPFLLNENTLDETDISNDNVVVSTDTSEIGTVESLNIKNLSSLNTEAAFRRQRCCEHDCQPNRCRPHDENMCSLHGCRPTWTCEQREKAHGAWR